MFRKAANGLLAVVLFVALGISPGSPTLAQSPEPFGPGELPFQYSGEQMVRAATSDLQNVILATGGPDDFGYTWDNGVPFAWVDATDGTDAGLSGYNTNPVGPVDLPFNFKFFEKTYSQVWILASGLISFKPQSAASPMGITFPVPDRYLNVIAPLFSRYNLASAGPANRVYYKSVGMAPTRRFIVEWYQVAYASPPYSGNTVFTFELILEENGDFIFQYQTLSNGGGYFCDDIAIGMQTWHGYDGLTYLSVCQIPVSNSAVKFTRPPDSARLQILNGYQGSFTRPNLALTYPLEIVNTGTLGDDTYNFSTTSTWPLTFLGANGEALVDSNGDGLVDTGVVQQGQKMTVQVIANTPTIIHPGEYNDMAVSLTSTLNPAKSKTAPLQAAVSVPFVQASNQGVTLYRPEGQMNSPELGYGFDRSIVETAQLDYLNAWIEGRWTDETHSTYVNEIWYAMVDRSGTITRAGVKLFDFGSTTDDSYDSDPVVAAAPDGSIALAWYRWLVRSDGKRNNNLYYAILNPAGQVVFGPVNVTNNSTWGAFNELDFTWVSSPVIAATQDNHFVLGWDQYYNKGNSDYVRNVAYTIFSTGNLQIKAPTLLTGDTPGFNPDCMSPAVTQVNENHVLVSFIRSIPPSNDDVWYAVLDSSGNIVKSVSQLSTDGTTRAQRSRADGVQVNNGSIVLAWDSSLTWSVINIQYALLDSSYNQIFGPAVISHQAMRQGSNPYGSNLSLAETPTGQAVLSWMDPDWNNSRRLYYALIQDDGALQTPPMIFRYTGGQAITGLVGYGNTSYSIDPTTPEVDAFVQAPVSTPTSAAGQADITVQFGNLGSTSASSVVVRATLPAGLSYISDTSGVTPVIQALSIQPAAPGDTQITWTFSTAMGFLAAGRFELMVGTGQAQAGTVYPVTLSIQTLGSDGDVSNNTYQANVVVMVYQYQPLLRR